MKQSAFSAIVCGLESIIASKQFYVKATVEDGEWVAYEQDKWCVRVHLHLSGPAQLNISLRKSLTAADIAHHFPINPGPPIDLSKASCFSEYIDHFYKEVNRCLTQWQQSPLLPPWMLKFDFASTDTVRHLSYSPDATFQDTLAEQKIHLIVSFGNFEAPTQALALGDVLTRTELQQLHQAAGAEYRQKTWRDKPSLL